MTKQPTSVTEKQNIKYCRVLQNYKQGNLKDEGCYNSCLLQSHNSAFNQKSYQFVTNPVSQYNLNQFINGMGISSDFLIKYNKKCTQVLIDVLSVSKLHTCCKLTIIWTKQGFHKLVSVSKYNLHTQDIMILQPTTVSYPFK